MRIVRQFLILAVLALVALGGYMASRYYADANESETEVSLARQPSAANVEVVTVALSPIEEQIEAVRRSVAIVPSAAGRIVALEFETGDVVERGAVLARLDDDIEQANLAEARAKLQEAQRALERGRSLRRTAISEVTLENLSLQEKIAAAELVRAERRLDDRTINAPFTGVVGLRRVDLGARVTEGTMITTLDDLEEVEIEFSVPEIYYGNIKSGQAVVATGTAFPDRDFVGEIVSIDSRVDVVSRSFKVRARIPNPERTLPAGMFMHLVIVLSTRDALMIPEESVVVQGSDTFVFLVEDGRAVRRTVALGQRRVGSIEVTAGLEAGDEVIVRGVQGLRDGSEVRVVGGEATAASAAEATG